MVGINLLVRFGDDSIENLQLIEDENMIKKFTAFALFALMLSSMSVQSEVGLTVTSFSYSDDLKAGDIFIWDVESNFTLLYDEFFEDESVIKLEVLKDLAGASFTGDLASTELPDYFALQFGTTPFTTEADSIHTIAFPDEVVLSNATTINPLQGLWIDLIVERFDFEDATVSATYTETGDNLEIMAEVEYKDGGLSASAEVTAVIDINLGITKDLHLLFDLPAFGLRSIDVVQRDISNTDPVEETTDDEALPISFIWFAIPIFVLPIIRKYRK